MPLVCTRADCTADMQEKEPGTKTWLFSSHLTNPLTSLRCYLALLRQSGFLVHRLRRQRRQLYLRVPFREEIAAPLFLEQDHRFAARIESHSGASWQLGIIDRRTVFGLRPPEHFPRTRFETRFGAVFGFHPVLHHFELQRSNSSQERHPLTGILELEGLHDTLLKQLFQPLPESFELSGARTLE